MSKAWPVPSITARRLALTIEAESQWAEIVNYDMLEDGTTLIHVQDTRTNTTFLIRSYMEWCDLRDAEVIYD